MRQTSSVDGKLRYAWIAWLFYSLLLVGKIATCFRLFHHEIPASPWTTTTNFLMITYSDSVSRSACSSSFSCSRPTTTLLPTVTVRPTSATWQLLSRLISLTLSASSIFCGNLLRTTGNFRCGSTSLSSLWPAPTLSSRHSPCCVCDSTSFRASSSSARKSGLSSTFFLLMDPSSVSASTYTLS
ncbi:hypothetical protein L596_006162 [Steinernema carpocapsae]|uniref:Uncharacterized protein n=1 Tax=Steinernema carpocapsae TaxID=34508 RepID=A0A4U8V198_STECR|nr:hypothetical protein L596_006162 [Steinernema carpocapsae]